MIVGHVIGQQKPIKGTREQEKGDPVRNQIDSMDLHVPKHLQNVGRQVSSFISIFLRKLKPLCF